MAIDNLQIIYLAIVLMLLTQVEAVRIPRVLIEET